MPLVIGALDRIKFAAKALPISAITGVHVLKKKVFGSDYNEFYASPALLYRNRVADARKRQHVTTTYDAFRVHMDAFDPCPVKRARAEARRFTPLADNNYVSPAAWRLDLRPGGRLDELLEHVYRDLGMSPKVYFIKHPNLVALKRIEIMWTDTGKPQIAWLDGEVATGQVELP